jgi:hypothetical protein
VNFSFHPLKTLAAIGALAALVHAGDYSTWTSYRPVTLSTSGLGLSAAVTNYPVSVRFKASAHKDMLDSAATQVQANGSDIRVTLADGTTDVPFEIEQLTTGANGRLHLWILASNVPANNASAATFRVYWGKTGQTTMSNPTATFPTSAGYQAVFHLNDTGATIANAANSGLNGIAIGTSTTTGQNAAQGYVSAKSGARVRAFGTSNGGEDNATPVENYIKIKPTAGHILSTHTGPLTLEGWIYSSISNSGNTSQGTKHIIAHGTGNMGSNAWFARTASLDGTGGQNHYSAGGPNNIQGPIAPFAEQHFWQYAVASWNGTSWTIYRQRESDPWNNPSVTGPTGMTPDSATYKTILGNAPTASTNPWYIGGAGDNDTGTTVSRGFHGWMEEVRISTVARDSNYVKLNFLITRTDSLAGIIHPVSIGATESPASVGSYGAWSNRRSIILNTTSTGANVATTVTNFPVLIRLGTAEASIIAAANGGNSIRFSKADNTTPLPYEIESWSTNSAAIWVKVDSVKGNNATQHIRMHWGNGAAASESNGAAVFDSANGYAAVFHMGGTNNTNPRPNSVPGGTAATPANLTTDAVKTGMIGLADSLGTGGTGATGSHLSFGPVPVGTITTGKATLSAWIKKTTWGAAWRHAISIGSGAPNNNFWFGTTGEAAGDLRVRTAQGTTEQTAINAPGAWVNETWQHIQVAYEPTGTNSVVYVNGVSAATGDIGHVLGNVERTSAYIGRALWNDDKFTGVFDEVRFQKTTRSAGWVKLEYENQKTVNSLVNIGIPVYTVPGQPTAVTATADTAAANVSWTAPADNGGKPILSYIATVVGDTLLTCSSATLTCKITNLPLGAPVNIVVRAVNEVGRGPNSLASNAVTPINPVVPSAPRTPSAVVNSSSAVTVSWLAPLSSGGVAITGYTVTGTATGAPNGTCSTTGELTCQVTGLNQGTTYSFTVIATNAAGNSAASTAVTAMTTSILPGAFVIAMDGSRNPYTYRLPAASVAATEKLSMTISDVQGKRIWTRTISPAASKINELTWNGTTSKGQAVAPGLYVVHLKAVMDGQVIEAIQKGVRQ